MPQNSTSWPRVHCPGQSFFVNSSLWLKWARKWDTAGQTPYYEIHNMPIPWPPLSGLGSSRPPSGSAVSDGQNHVSNFSTFCPQCSDDTDPCTSFHTKSDLISFHHSMHHKLLPRTHKIEEDKPRSPGHNFWQFSISRNWNVYHFYDWFRNPCMFCTNHKFPFYPHLHIYD